MNAGRIEQFGTPSELYLGPATRFVATFLGEVNRLPAQRQGSRVETPIGALDLGNRMPADDGPLEVLLRPEGLRVRAGAWRDGDNEGTAAEVEACRLIGATTLVHMAVPDGRGGLLHLHARLPPGIWLTRGEKVSVSMDAERAFVFPAEAS
jgi:iron(III) transport system ATP-binding protein